MLNKLVVASLALMSSVSVFAQENAAAAVSNNDKGMLYIAAIFGVSFAAGMAALAQSKASVAALEGIARNPAATDKIFTPMLLALALNESLVIFTMVSIFLVK
jgi:F-type H+-transporting ATPase subunit c